MPTPTWEWTCGASLHRYTLITVWGWGVQNQAFNMAGHIQPPHPSQTSLLQNEPLDGNIPDFTFNCMGWNASSQATWIGQYLGPTLEVTKEQRIKSPDM